MRLIDADRLKNALIGLMDTSSPVPSDNDCAIDGMLNLLNDQPTVDLVKHGYWIKRNSVGTATCSVCGGLIMNFYNKDANTYCHNCGAKMDGDEGEID